MNIIPFPKKSSEFDQNEEDYQATLRMLRPFADQPDALVQVLARCLVRLDNLERAIGSTN